MEQWKAYIHALSTVVAHGIAHITTSHATILSAYILMEYDGASDAAKHMDETWFEGKSTGDGLARSGDGGLSSGAQRVGGVMRSETRQKALLKQNLFYFNNTAGYGASYGGDQAVGGGGEGATGQNSASSAQEPFRVGVVNAIVSGLGWHAVMDRERLRKLRTSPKMSRGEVYRNAVRLTVDSYLNCIRSLIDIGENTIRRLPPNAHTMALGGRIVRALVLASIDMDPSEIPHEGYVGTKFSLHENFDGGDQEGQSGALIRPKRYADAITYASKRLNSCSYDSNNTKNTNDESIMIDCILDSSPNDDVHDVVRSLFVRDLVDVTVSGCGYGDFLLWTRLAITPLDPMLFDHVSQYPDREEEQTAGSWGLNEEGDALSGDVLAARYDFTLLMMIRAWNAPWTPTSSFSFSVPFRKAITTLALCAHRYGVPADIAAVVNSFLPREWWSDDRRQCWCHDCQLKQVSDMIRDKVAKRECRDVEAAVNDKAPPPPTMHNTSILRLSSHSEPKLSALSTVQTCPGCNLAMYCSREHRKYLWQDGHKRVCGTPPFRVPGVDEELFCREVFGGPTPTATDTYHENESVGLESHTSEVSDEVVSDDDSGDWESIDSNEESPPVEECTKTEIIHRFFDSKAYKVQDRQPPPFGAVPIGQI